MFVVDHNATPMRIVGEYDRSVVDDNGWARSGDAIDASFGVSVYEPGDDPERLVVRADEALYQAKRRREQSRLGRSA